MTSRAWAPPVAPTAPSSPSHGHRPIRPRIGLVRRGRPRAAWLQRLETQARRAARSVADGAAVVIRDIGNGMLEVSHNLLALLGLVVLVGAAFVLSHGETRQDVERHTFDWLQERLDARKPPAERLAAAIAEPDAVERATAADPEALDRQQQRVANWISRRYRVAPEPVARLVQEAWTVGAKAGLDPALILAIMAIESSFNPFAQSPVGAQGLMQVMTRIHDDKYEAFGGTHAAFDPVTNLRVGVQVLKECIARAGSLEGGLKFYVGAANLSDDGGYAARVLAERDHLRKVASGQAVPFNAPLNVAQAAAAVVAAAAVPSPTLHLPASTAAATLPGESVAAPALAPTRAPASAPPAGSAGQGASHEPGSPGTPTPTSAPAPVPAAPPTPVVAMPQAAAVAAASGAAPASVRLAGL